MRIWLIVAMCSASFGCRPARVDTPRSATSPLAAMVVRDAAGTTLRFDDLRRDVTVVALWASWCSSCEAGLPGLEQVARRHRGEPDVAFVAIDADVPAAVPRARGRIAELAPSVPCYFADEAEMLAPVLPHMPDGRPVLEVPAVLVIDRSGRVHALDDATQHEGLDAVIAQARRGEMPARPNDQRKSMAMEVRLRDGALQIDVLRVPSRREAAIDAVAEFAIGLGASDGAELRASIDAQLDGGRVTIPLPPSP